MVGTLTVLEWPLDLGAESVLIRLFVLALEEGARGGGEDNGGLLFRPGVVVFFRIGGGCWSIFVGDIGR